jgi:hypothetical protein
MVATLNNIDTMAPANGRIEIPLSKVKLGLLCCVTIIFVAAGVVLLMDYNPATGPDNKTLTGFIALIFFGLSLIVLLRKISDKRPGLIIDENGLTDNSSDVSICFIEWDNIIGFSSVKISANRIILVEVSHPEQFVARARGIKMRLIMRVNHYLYGSPLFIASAALKMGHDTLYHLLITQLERQKQRPNR